MNLVRIFLLSFITLLSFNASLVNAADATNKKFQATELEKKRIAAEFDQVFKTSDNGTYQKLNRNPWANKRAKQQRQAKRVLKISASLGSCQEYSLKQRRQCYAKGDGTAMCERYYRARMNHCSEYF